MKIPLTSGAYQARSIIANAQRCVNLYPEKNSDDPGSPVTHYPTPGLIAHSSPPSPGAGRGIYITSSGARFDVVGSNVYSVSPDGAYTKLLTLLTAENPVSMRDNGTQ